MEYDNPTFTLRHEAPFTWTVMHWPRTDAPHQSCLVSFDLADELGWFRGNGVYSNVLIMGPLRFRATMILDSKKALACERASGELEEFVRGALFRVKELVTSAWHYYFGPKHTHG